MTSPIVKMHRDGHLLSILTLTPRICQILEGELSYTRVVHLRGEQAIRAKSNVRCEPMVCFEYRKDPDGILPARMVVGSGFLTKIASALREAGYRPLLKDTGKSSSQAKAFKTYWDRMEQDTGWRWGQRECVQEIARKQCGRIACPPGWGKSFIIRQLCRLWPHARIGVTTHAVDVVEQLHEDLSAFLPNVGLICGRRKLRGDRVTVYSGKSLHYIDEPLDVLFVDECVTGDAKISTPSGFVRLEDVTVGVEVMCYDGQKVVVRPVTKVWSRGPKSILRLITSTGRSIRCTENHPVLVATGCARSWVPAGKLRPGHSILCLALESMVRLLGGVTQEVLLSIGRLAQKEDVYDIEVEEHHNFFANGLLVHNCHEWATDDYLKRLAIPELKYARKYGFSATQTERPDAAHFELEGPLGPVIVDISYQEGVEHGCVVPIEVRWHDVEMTVDPVGGCVEPTARERQGLWRNMVRNEIIQAAARGFDDEHQVLISVDTVEHAMFLKGLLPEYTLCYSPAGLEPQEREWYIQGGLIESDEPEMTALRRRQLKTAFERGGLKKVIATTVWKRGVDFKLLSTLIRADGKNSPVSDYQIPGRTSRICAEVGKQKGMVLDFKDQFNGTFKRRAQDRRRNYESRGWVQIDPFKKVLRRRGAKQSLLF